MAQHDYIISNATFPAVRTDINNALSAIQTNNSGTSRPTGAVAGQIWLDTTNATSPTLKFYDGADDISLATINYTSNTVDWLDSSITITGLSTTATGTVLTLSDTANTTSQNLIIDNQKEIRFRETTANGTNYVGFKAPASLSADTIWTLPSADGTANQVLQTNGSGTLSFATVTADGTADWDTTVKTSGFTATANKGYFCNTTSSAFTVTLPASPTAGDEIIIIDYAGTFDTNNLTISPNGNKIEGSTANQYLSGDREAVRLAYIDSTQGWIGVSGFQEGSDAIIIPTYSVDFLVIAGGGSGGGGTYGSNTEGGGAGGAGGYRTSTQTVSSGTVITVTVGDGGSAVNVATNGNAGSDSSISGSGLTTITSTGGGRGGKSDVNGGNGGSGGGAGSMSSGTGSGGTGNTPSTSPSQGNNGGSSSIGAQSGGGGGAGGAGSTGSYITGGNGGNGTASSITGSSVTRAGGGGGGSYNNGTGGTGGGGGGGNVNSNGVSGTANTGSGGGGLGATGSPQTTVSGAGGKGVVILSMLTSKYSGTTSGSPTVTTSGSNTILQFNGSGSYTA